MDQPLQPADLILTLCSLDDSIAVYTAELYRKGFAPQIIFSGGSAHQDDLLNTGWDRPEAEVFTEIAIKQGVPATDILIENQAQNTGENIRFSYQMIQDRKILHERIILVQKPYMGRRTFATFARQWPGQSVTWSVTSPPCTFGEYLARQTCPENIIQIMVGDLQRIKVYPDLGFQIEQIIPDTVWKAYVCLIEAGFTKHVIKNTPFP